MPLFIEDFISDQLVDLYCVPSNEKYPFSHLETYDFVLERREGLTILFRVLTHYKYMIPLITLAREILIEFQYGSVLNPSKKIQHIVKLDGWFTSLPSEIQYTRLDTKWKGRGVAWMNGLYHSLRLRILREKFLELVELLASGNGFTDLSHSLIMEQCVNSINSMTLIAHIFVQSRLKGFQSESTFLQSCIYFAGLCGCVLTLCYKDYVSLEKRVTIHLEAMSAGYGGKDVESLTECGFTGLAGVMKAYELIKKDHCWFTLGGSTRQKAR